MRTLLLAASFAVLVLVPGRARAVDYYEDWYQRNQEQSRRMQEQMEDSRRAMHDRQEEYNQRLQQQQLQELLDGQRRLERNAD
jgi:hypothetical protein